MTTAPELKQEILDFLKEKREELTAKADEESLPWIKTIAEPETEDDEEYAQKELDEVLMDNQDCTNLLNALQEWLDDYDDRETKSQKRRA